MSVSKFLLAAILALAGQLWGQNQGSMSGRITDNAGANIPNAVIVVTETTTGASQRVVTGADGAFTIASLPAGTYRVEVEANGARRTGRTTVQIISGSPAQINITLDPASTAASTSGTVEIKATSPTLQTDSAEVSRSYGSRTITSLPLLDRQYQELITLMPGTTPPLIEQDRVMDPQRRRSFNVNGQAPFANVYHQDSGYQTEPFQGNIARVSPNDSVQSLNVRTSNYNAEHGFAGGSLSNTVTRTGTNGIHGSLFGFNTNSYFTTRNPVNVANNPDPRMNQNQFGGSVGMPFIKDHMFGFLSYEGYLRRGSQTQFATVPTDAMRAGNFSEVSGLTLFDPNTGNAMTGANRTPFANNRIPANRFNPASIAILNFIPAANQPGLANNFVGNVPLIDDNHRIDAKLDHRFSDSSTGFLRYGFTHGSVNQGSLLGPLGGGASANLRNHVAVASLSEAFGANTVGEFRFGYSRYRNAILPWSGLSGNPSDFNSALAGTGFTNGLPQITISGLGTLGTNFPSRQISNTYHGATNWILNFGPHRLKAGADVRNLRSDGWDAGLFSPQGSFLFGPGATTSATATAFDPLANSFAAFLLGAPSQSGVNQFQETPTYRQWHYGGYVTDTINLWQRVYLELGVRYEVYSPVETRFSSGAMLFNPATNQTSAFDKGDYDLNNVAPRVGFAIRPTNRLVIRGGYGFHYFPVPFALTGLNQAAAAIQQGFAGSFGTARFAVPTIPATATGPNGETLAPNQPFYVTPMKIQTPYVQTYSLMVQGDLGNGFLFDVGYVGNLGRHLPYSRALVGTLGGGLAGNPFFTEFGRTAPTTERGTGLNSNYNSLQVNLTKQFAGGLAFAGSYSFSKALDYGFEQADPFDTRGNYGPADWDRSHVLAVSHVWQLPFGPGSPYFNSGAAAHILGNWELNGILRWATGTPYTVMADPLFANTPGLSSVRADFTGSGSVNGQSNFDPSLFSFPGRNSFGTLGRNTLRGPDLFTYNMSLFRNFQIHEGVRLELRGEVYNLTNSPNYATPVNILSTPGFGRSLRTFNGLGGRQFQVGARLSF